MWRLGYMDELNSLKEMGVYTLVPQSEVPHGDKIQKGHPIFKIKWDKNGVAVQWRMFKIVKYTYT
jgi:hypothetical protein